MPHITHDGQKVYYEVHGEGPALFLLHDLFEDHTFFKPIIEVLKKDFKVIALDLKGSGQSTMPKKDFKCEAMALDVLAIADELGIDQFHVLGDSLGATAAQWLAYKHPKRVEKLILANPFIKLSNSSLWFLEMAADLFKEKLSYPEVFKLVMPWFYSSWFLEFEDNVKALLKEVKSSKHPLKEKAYKLQLEALKSFDSSKWLGKIEAPTLLILGEEDLFTLFRDSRALVTKIKNHQVELCPGGHKSKKESQSRFIEVVKKFLTKEES